MMTKDEILYGFKYSLSKKKEIRLINSFKGLPISFNAVILSVNGDFVTVGVDRSQIVCMYRDHETFIQGEGFRDTVKAQVVQINLNKLECVLSHFETPKNSFNDRAYIRVEPDNPINGNIKAKEARIPFRGQLADISQGGLGIYIEERLFYPNIYRPGAEITIEISLPALGKMVTRTTVRYEDKKKDERFDPQSTRINLFGELSKPATSLTSTTYNLNSSGNLELRGIVVKSQREPAYQRYRIGIKLAPNDVNYTVINQFINTRQAEIINEIRAEYNTLLAKQQNR